MSRYGCVNVCREKIDGQTSTKPFPTVTMRGGVASTHTLGHGKAKHGQALKGGVASLPEQACPFCVSALCRSPYARNVRYDMY